VNLLIRVAAFAAALVLTSAGVEAAVSVRSGFANTVVLGGLSQPTAMAFAPDGRLFVCQQAGALRVVKNGQLLSTPFVTVAVDPSGERGLLGVAVDPLFPVNHYIYVYYTTNATPRHNRVSRFTANGDVALAGSEVVLLELNALSSATNHNGGALNFGPDGHLYVAVGDNANWIQRADPLERAREDSPHPRRWIDSGGQPILLDRLGRESRHLGAGPSQPIHLHVPARHGADIHQRCRSELARGDRRGRGRGQLRLAIL
jgi:glucose/arabinose dehydrogenase